MRCGALPIFRCPNSAAVPATVSGECLALAFDQDAATEEKPLGKVNKAQRPASQETDRRGSLVARLRDWPGAKRIRFERRFEWLAWVIAHAGVYCAFEEGIRSYEEDV